MRRARYRGATPGAHTLFHFRCVYALGIRRVCADEPRAKRSHLGASSRHPKNQIPIRLNLGMRRIPFLILYFGYALGGMRHAEPSRRNKSMQISTDPFLTQDRILGFGGRPYVETSGRNLLVVNVSLNTLFITWLFGCSRLP